MPDGNIPLACHGYKCKRKGAGIAFWRETQIVRVPLPSLA